MARNRKATQWVASAFGVITLILLMLAGIAHAASYVYDANGRLRAITASTGASSEYIYDALGNLVAVDSVPAGVTAVFAFTPNHGPVGQSVTIMGLGFSTTKTSNTVKFNGTPVISIASATATQLVVTVPAGATTGPVSVTVGSSTASSLDNFYVTTDSGGQPPIVTSFTPLITNAGTSVAVTGSHFVATAGATQAGVDDFVSTVTPTSDTQLSFPVSANTGSGYVTVTTPYGTGQSAQPLIVVPTSVGAANVIATAMLTVGGSTQVVNVGTANKFGAIAFQAVAGQWLSIQFSSLTTVPSSGSLSVSVYDPSGATVLTSATVSSANLSLHLPPAGRNGTYTAIVGAGAATCQFTVGLESAVTLTSTPTSIGANVNGQSKRAIFDTLAGTNLSLGMSNLIATPSYPLSYLILTPEAFGGLEYLSGTCTPPGCHQSLLNVPNTGWYSVVFKPYATTTASFAANISTDVAATLTANHAYSLNLSKSGQIARLTFSGTAGQYIGFNIGSLAAIPAGDLLYATLIYPDGTIRSAATSVSASTFINEPVLTQTGTYMLQIDPQYADTDSAQLTLALNPTGTLTVNGSTVPESVTFPGEAIYYSFAGTAGQYLSLAFPTVTTSDSQPIALSGSIVSGGCTPPGCHLLLNNLPSTSTYLIQLTPSLSDTASVTSTLSSDVSTALTPGTLYPMNLAKPGQTARLTFTGSIGQFVGYNLTNIVSSVSGDPITVTTFNPDGTRNPAGGVTTAANTYLNLPELTQAGTYVVQVEPTNAETATANLTLTSDPDPTLIINGSSATLTTTSANESAALTFSATAGQNLSLAFDNFGLSPITSGGIVYSVFNPNSTFWEGGTFGGSFHQLLTIPTTGVYTVEFHPGDARNTMTFRATLTSDLAGTLTVGAATPVNLTTPGQTSRLTFSGTAGQNSALYASGVTTTPSGMPIYITVFNPDGTTKATGAATSNQLTILPTLVQTGTYVVQVEPYGADPSTAQLTLVNDPSTTITVDGTTVNESTTEPGEYAYLTFSGTAGQNLSLGITNASTSPSSGTFTVRILNPSQTQIGVAGCATSGCHIALPSLVTTGTYTIKIDTAGTAETVSFSATLYSDLTGSLVANTAFPISVTHAGQAAHLTFSGTAGQNDAILISSITTVPAGDTATVTVFNPDGTTAAAVTTAPNDTLNLPTLTQTGTYVAQVEFKNADTGSLQLTLSSTVPGALTVDGPAIPESTGTPNQVINLSFTGTAGSNVTLAISNVNPSTATFQVSVYDPNSNYMQVQYGSFATSGENAEFVNLPSTGTYTIKVIPNVAASFNMQLMSVVSAALTVNTPYTLNLSKPGQMALLTFSGTAGIDEGLYVTNLVNTPSTDMPAVLISNPDGTEAGGEVFTPNNSTLDMWPVFQSGTFTALVAPQGADTLSIQFTLTIDPATTMTVNGSAITLAPPHPGQSESITYVGTANEAATLRFTNAATVPSGQYIHYWINDPSGNQYSAGGCSTSSCNQSNPPMPSSGTYTVYIYPDAQTDTETTKLQITSP